MWILFMAVASAGVLKAELAAGETPPGITATWVFTQCNPTVRIMNNTNTTVSVDWMQSTVAVNGQAVGLVPGSTSQMASYTNMAPTAIPPGTYAEEVLFRKDRMGDPDHGCMLDAVADMSFSFSVGSGWLRQPVAMRPDLEASYMAVYARAVLGYNACISRVKAAEAKLAKRQKWAWVVGGGIAGVGLVTIATARPNDPEGRAEGAGQVIGGVVTWGAMYFIPTPDLWETCIRPVKPE